MYDSRLGRWLSPDKVVKGYLSSYQFGKNNPIINIDPDGNTEYYFQGKWTGTDGVNNNLIGIVKSKDISNQMKKGEYKYPNELTNGSNGTDAFIIDADVLKTANKVLNLSLTQKGKTTELGTRMVKDGSGKYVSNGIAEGKANDLTKRENAHVSIEGKGGVPIHSHPTGSGVITGTEEIKSFDASRASQDDQDALEDAEFSIIVGKNGGVGGTVGPALIGTGKTVVPSDNRKKGGFINIFTKDSDDKAKPSLSIPGGEATDIIKDYDPRAGKQ